MLSKCTNSFAISSAKKCLCPIKVSNALFRTIFVGKGAAGSNNSEPNVKYRLTTTLFSSNNSNKIFF